MKYLTKYAEPKINGDTKSIGLFFSAGYVVFFENKKSQSLSEKFLESGAMLAGASVGLAGLPVFLAGYAIASLAEPKKRELSEALKKAKEEFNLDDESFFIAVSDEIEVTISGKRLLSLGDTFAEIREKFSHAKGNDDFHIQFTFDESKSTLKKIFTKAGIQCSVLWEFY